MSITIHKTEILVNILLLRIAQMLGINTSGQQYLREQMVMLHIRLQIEREQATNKQLFS